MSIFTAPGSTKSGALHNGHALHNGPGLLQELNRPSFDPSHLDRAKRRDRLVDHGACPKGALDPKVDGLAPLENDLFRPTGGSLSPPPTILGDPFLEDPSEVLG